MAARLTAAAVAATAAYLASMIVLQSERDGGRARLAEELLSAARREFRTDAAHGIETLDEALRVAPHRRRAILDAMRPTLRELIDQGAIEPQARMLALALRARGLEGDPELRAIEDSIYRRTRGGRSAYEVFAPPRFAGAPVVSGERLLLPRREGGIDAVRVSDGRMAGRPFDGKVPIQGDLLELDGHILFATVSGTIRCLKSADLSSLWSVTAVGRMYRTPRLAGADSRVAVLWSQEGMSRVQAFHLRSGDRAWKPASLEGEPTFLAAGAGLLVAGTTDGATERVSLLDARTGRLVYEFLGRAPGARGATILSGPNGALVVGAAADGAFALSPSARRPAWSAPLGAPPCAAPVAWGDRVVFAAADGRVICLDAASGAAQWSVELSAPVSAPMAAAGGRIFAAAGTELFAVSVRDGSAERFEARLDGPAEHALLVHQGLLLAFTGAKVRAVRTGGREEGGWRQAGGGPGRLNRPE